MIIDFKLGEFFCGPGGIALGAIKSEFKKDGSVYRIVPEWATDYDYETCETFARNIHKVPLAECSQVIHEDVKNLDIASLLPCDGFAFGFPCNDFSLVGQSRGLDGKFGPLYSYGVEYLKQHQPKWFIAENVSGLNSSGEGKTFQLILSELKDAGYRITSSLYKFEDYGVPQARHRLIIVGMHESLKLRFRVPAPTHVGFHRTSSDAICNPPIAAESCNHEFTKQSNQVIARLKFISPGGNIWSENIPEEHRLKVGGAKLSNIYKRLDPKKPAYTVTGSGGGGTHMYHWSEPRALTNRERARLQTFPDNYIFYGKKESVRKQIGMAVPPDGISVIFEAILKTLAGEEYSTNEPYQDSLNFS